ncbi:MAG: hypothetical protein H7263_14895 [Candidatus Sericytochromatia bacterium]|nr:hypothetical protein [Candidatus Sericytochromatia bacterium]
MKKFIRQVNEGESDITPNKKSRQENINEYPKKKPVLSYAEKELEIKYFLKYFPEKDHKELAKQFAQELEDYGQIFFR